MNAILRRSFPPFFMPRKKKIKPLFSQDEAERFAAFVDVHLKQAEYAVDKLRDCRNDDNAQWVDPTLKYWQSVRGGLLCLVHNLHVLGTDSPENADSISP